MGFHFRICDNDRPHFVTMTVVDWVNIFNRKNHCSTLIDSLKYCQKNKGLEIFAWCLMPSHLHLIVRASEGYRLADTIRDFKRHTSKAIIQQMKDECDKKEEGILNRFKMAALQNSKSGEVKFWKDGYHPVELYSPGFIAQKLKYIHDNPVKAMLVEKPCDYIFSSARNYSDMDYLLDVIKIV